jgi:hypothetical protein
VFGNDLYPGEGRCLALLRTGSFLDRQCQAQVGEIRVEEPWLVLAVTQCQEDSTAS